MSEPVAPGSRSRERGAVLLLSVIVMVALVGMASIVTDIGAMRVMRRSSQTLVDLAALAAGDALAGRDGPDGPAACTDAVGSLRLNSPDLASLTLPCDSLPRPCDATTSAATVTEVTGRYRVAITYPVPDASIADARVSGGLRRDDGQPCERLRIRIDRTEATILSGVLGQSNLSISATSVVRQVAAENRRAPSLWLLDPRGCDVLSVHGGARVTVGTSTMPGLISTDSDGSGCTGNSYTVDVGGSGSVLHAVPSAGDPAGAIALFAMTPAQTTCAEGNLRACDPSDVANSTLSPQPVPRPWRATRAPVDHIYNCLPSYPSFHGIPVAPCEDATPSYIGQLRAGVGTSGIPTGFQRWTSAHRCNVASGTTTVHGNWVVDCSTFSINTGTDVVFAGGNVVFDGDIKMTGGSLTLNSANPTATLSPSCAASVTGCLTASSAGAAWAYMRSGNLDISGGALVARQAMIYQHAGYFSMTGGSQPQWASPQEGPFAGLAVWSEMSTTRFSIYGGASMALEGVFFTPNANPFLLSGGSPFVPQRAQFIAFRAAISGGAVLALAPNSPHAIKITAPPVSLIR